MNKFHVTLQQLREKYACAEGYNKVVRNLQGCPFTAEDAERTTHIRFAHKEPISILSILESNGLDDALWALRCIENADKDRDVRLFAVWCARQVQHLMTDQRSIDALDVAERYANGVADDGELSSARAAARATAMDAPHAASMAATRATAWAATRATAWAASMAATRAATRATAWAAAWAAARAAARAADVGVQKAKLTQMLTSGFFDNQLSQGETP